MYSFGRRARQLTFTASLNGNSVSGRIGKREVSVGFEGEEGGNKGKAEHVKKERG